MENTKCLYQRQNPHYFHHEVLDLLDEMLEVQELNEKIKDADDSLPIKKVLRLTYSSVDRCRDQVFISVKLTQQRAVSSLVVYRNYNDEPQFEPVTWYKTTLLCHVGLNQKYFSTTVVIYMTKYPETIESEIFFDVA